MWKMIGNNIVVPGLLLWLIAASYAFSSTSEDDFEGNCLWSFNAKVKLLNDWKDVLKSSGHSYIPYHEEDVLVREPEWMYNVYKSILEEHGKKYDVFYVDISEYEQSNFLFIKNNMVFVYTPYLKIPGCKEKIYDAEKWKGMIRDVEEELFQEKNPEKVMELVRQLRSLKEAAYEVESYSKRLPDEIVKPLVMIMKGFQELHKGNRRLKGYELDTLYDYMWNGESLVLTFYGLDSSLFGVSLRCFTISGSPGIYVGSIYIDLIRYVKSNPAHEQMDLDWLKGKMKELPFVRDFH